MTPSESTLRPPAVASAPSGLRQWRILAWLGAEPISLIGDQVFLVTLTWTTVQAYGAGTTGLVLAAAAIPRVLLMLAGGVLVDRVGAKRLALFSDATRGVLMLAAAAFVATAGTPLAFLLVLAAIFGTIDAVFYPATGALPPLVVTSDQLLRVQNLRALGTRAALIIGAPLGGALISLGGAEICLLVNAGTFAVSTIGLALLRTRPLPANDPSEAFTAQVVDGLRHAARHPLLRNLLLLVALFEFAVSGIVNVAYPALADQNGWGAEGFGLLLAGIGVGAGATAAALAAVARTPAPGLVTAGCGLLGATLLALFPFTAGLPAALAIAVALGAVGGGVAGIAIPLVQHSVPAAQLGRAMSLFAIATVGTAPLSLAGTALLTRHAGLPATFLTAAALVLTAAFACLTSRPLRAATLAPPRTPA